MIKRAFERFEGLLRDTYDDGTGKSFVEMYPEAPFETMIELDTWGEREPGIPTQRYPAAAQDSSSPGYVSSSVKLEFDILLKLSKTFEKADFFNSGAGRLGNLAESVLRADRKNIPAVEALERLASHPNVQNRRAAAIDACCAYLTGVEPPALERLETLIETLGADTDVYSFLGVAEALFLKNRTFVVNRCRDLLSNPDWMIRRLAADQLLKAAKADSGALDVLVGWLPSEPSTRLGVQVAMAIGDRLKPEALETLVRLGLADESPSLRIDSTRLLRGHFGPTLAAEIAAVAIADEPDPLIRRMLRRLTDSVD